MSRKAFYALAESHGIGIRYMQPVRHHPRTGEALGYEITLEAPEGKQFVATGCAVDCYLRGDSGDGCVIWKPDWRECMLYLLELIEAGFDDSEEDEVSQ